MPTVVFNETVSKKITRADADNWIAAQKEIDLRIAGSLLYRDFSYNDLDLTLHTHPCKEIITKLTSAAFPIQIFCRICGATMNYSPKTDTWTWRYSEKLTEKTLAFPLGMVAVSAKAFYELKEKVDKLKSK